MVLFSTYPNSIFHIEREDIPILKVLNDNYRDIWGKSAFSINSSNLYVEFNKNIVGFIKINEKIIIIKPKIKDYDFNYIIRMWSYLNFSNYRNLSLEIPNFEFSLKDNNINIAEIFVNILLKLIQKGLFGRYIEHELETSFKKGRINYKKKFYKFYYEGKFTCLYETFTLDNFLNQVIYYCLNKIRSSISTPKLVNKTVYLMNIFKDIKLLSYIDTHSIDSIRLNRQNNYYKNIIALCKIIVKNLSIASIKGISPNYSFLFDFNYLFEEFIKCILKLYSIRNEFTFWKTFRIFGSYYKEDGEIILKKYLPDILYKFDNKNNSAEIVIDVKNKFEGIFINKDLYQLTFYCNILKTTTGILIYPSIKPKEMIPLSLELSGKKFTFYAVFFPIGGDNDEFYKSIKQFLEKVYKIIEK